MDPARFQTITRKYPKLRIAVVGDFCLDRYLEIDPAQKEISIETGLPVYNVVNVRSQPGGAGTILSNLVALGIGEVYPVGFAGEDGEGFELTRALQAFKTVRTEAFFSTRQRRTFTYTKPLLLSPGKVPVELNRFDIKNQTPTPAAVQKIIVDAVANLAPRVDAIILMDQVEVPETGVITSRLLRAIHSIAKNHPELLILADSRRSLIGYPPVSLKMNRAELAALTGTKSKLKLKGIKSAALALAKRQGRDCFVTLAEDGILGASADGRIEQLPASPLRGAIDVVGAGDAVTANLTAALTAGAGLYEALRLATTAASVVIHKLGTTGTASVTEIRSLLAP